MRKSSEVELVAEQVESRLASSQWDIQKLDELGPPPQPTVTQAAEVAAFALKLSGKRPQATKGSRFRRLIARFALAACLALASVAAACDKPDASDEEAAETVRTLPAASATEAVITQETRGSPARFEQVLLVDPGSDTRPFAVVVPRTGSEAPILVDRVGAGLNDVGKLYNLPATPVAVGTRDGASQFLDPLAPATEVGDSQVPQAATQLAERWKEDERFAAATRAIAGQPTVLDAAYNAQAAVEAGGTHTYMNGVVLRVDPDQPVVSVIDRALLESGRPTREEDVVHVAIRPGEKSLYQAGQVVNLRDVAMTREQTDVEGEQRTFYIANAALEGSRVEPNGQVDLQALMGQRLARVDGDLATQQQEVPAGAAPAAAAATPQPAATGAPVQQPVIVNQSRSSYVDDFLIFMLLANSGFFRGPGWNAPTFGGGGGYGNVYYSPGPRPSGSTPATVASQQTESRNSALQAARTSVSGQAAGTGGGVAASNKSAADVSSRANAATAKAASSAGAVSSASAGKSISSVARSTTSTTASRSAGTVSAGSRGTSGSTSSTSGSGGKGIGGSSGGFGGSGATSGGSS